MQNKIASCCTKNSPQNFNKIVLLKFSINPRSHFRSRFQTGSKIAPNCAFIVPLAKSGECRSMKRFIVPAAKHLIREHCRKKDYSARSACNCSEQRKLQLRVGPDRPKKEVADLFLRFCLSLNTLRNRPLGGNRSTSGKGDYKERTTAGVMLAL